MSKGHVGRWLTSAALVCAAAALTFVPSVAAAPPANDDFVNAETIAGDSGSLDGTNLEATAEPGEPAHAGYPAQASVWYTWTASADGIAAFDTCAASFDTRLAVYRGTALADLSEVASSDDSDDCGTGSLQSSLSFAARAGTIYSIAVDGFFGATGTFRLTWDRLPLPPTNATRPVVTGPPFDTETLTIAPGEWESAGSVSYSYQWQHCAGPTHNVALEKPAYASRVWGPDFGPEEAVDGSPWTYWSAGAGPPQWIVVDLRAPYPVSMIRASITQLPDGFTTHRFLAAGPNPLDEFQLLGTFSGVTIDEQVLEQPGPATEVEFIRVETTESPSWVAWREIEAFTGCSDIPAATGATYTLTPADVGSTVRGIVTATNSTGSTAASSPATATVALLAPVNLEMPTISGTARHNALLSGTNGTWRGSMPITYSYQWERCGSGPAQCVEIPRATEPEYVVRLADAGSVLRLMVSATNTAGATTAASAATAAVPYQCIVPSLTRRTLRAARARLRASHCRLGKVRRRYSSRVSSGRIISQRPAKGTELPDRGKVSVVISRGRPR